LVKPKARQDRAEDARVAVEEGHDVHQGLEQKEDVKRLL
jgi:hypothetical protein